jgi:hypothetical protein
MNATTNKKVHLNARLAENLHANAKCLARLSHTALFCSQSKVSGHLVLIKARATVRQIFSSMCPLQYRITNSLLNPIQPTRESR